MPDSPRTKQVEYIEHGKEYHARPLYSPMRQIRWRIRVNKLHQAVSWVIAIGGVLVYFGGWGFFIDFYDGFLGMPNWGAAILTFISTVVCFGFCLAIQEPLRERATRKLEILNEKMQQIQDFQNSSQQPGPQHLGNDIQTRA